MTFQLGFQIGVAVFQLPHAIFDLCGWGAFADRINKLVEFFVVFGKLFFHAQALFILLSGKVIQFGMEGRDKLFHQLWLHQIIAQAVQNNRFDFLFVEDQMVLTRAFVFRIYASIAVAVNRVASATARAFQQA